MLPGPSPGQVQSEPPGGTRDPGGDVDQAGARVTLLALAWKAEARAPVARNRLYVMSTG